MNILKRRGRSLAEAAIVTVLLLSLFGPARLAPFSSAADNPPSRGRNPFFAFCMDTHDSQKRTLKDQAALLKELGYAGAGHLWLDQVPERLATLREAGLQLFQVYVALTLDPQKAPYDPRLKDVLPLLKDSGATLALLISGGKPSDPAGDERAVSVVREIADLAQRYQVGIVLYPHAGDWLERLEDAVRIAGKVQRRNVGVMFNLCHWLKVDDEKNLALRLQQAKPYLRAVSLNGADHAVDIRAGKGAMILPLDRGAFDLLAFLRLLQALPFEGPIGLQCYGLPGDARDHLARSMAAWQRFNEQLGRE